MFVTIIVPAYKKEKLIYKNIKSIYETMVKTRYRFEIIVVVDGFLDKTLENASKFRRKNVKVIGYRTNRGKGFAIRFGMYRAKGDFIAFIDAGMEIDANGISMILEHMIWYKADIIVGSKRHQASKVNYTIMRKIYSWGYHFGVKLLFRLKLTDTQVGLKVFRREVLKKILPRLVVKQFAFDIELLAVAHRLGFTRIYEAPVEMHLDFIDSSFQKSLFLDPLIRNILRDTLGVFYRMKFLQYYDDKSSRKWVYDTELHMKINTGEKGKVGESDVLEDSTLRIRKRKEKIKYSIIIPVRSINKYLVENINHLKQLSYSKFEVLIILDKKVKYNFKDKRFKILATGEKGPGEKRNIGVRKSTGDILVFLDDDAYPSQNWLNEASLLFDDKNILVLGAPAVTPLDAPILESCSGRLFESWITSADAARRYTPMPTKFVSDYPTVNLFVRKKVFFNVGGFVEDFWPGEDTKFCLDLVKLYGNCILYHPSPIVYHHRRRLFIPHLKQISRYGRHRGQFARIFPETSRLPSYFVPSLFVIGLLIGPVTFLFSPVFKVFYFYVLLAYFSILLYESVKVMFMNKSLLAGVYVFLGIFLTHMVYGINFIIGIAKRPKLKLRNIDSRSGNYLGG